MGKMSPVVLLWFSRLGLICCCPNEICRLNSKITHTFHQVIFPFLIINLKDTMLKTAICVSYNGLQVNHFAPD